MLNEYFIKSPEQSSLSWILIMWNKHSMNFNKQLVTTHYILSISINTFARKLLHVFGFSYNCNLEWRSRPSNCHQNVDFSYLYHHTKFETKQSANARMQSDVKMVSLFLHLLLFFKWNHISRALTLEYWSDIIKWVWESLDQQVSTVKQIPEINYFVRWLMQKLLLSCIPETLNEGQGHLV